MESFSFRFNRVRLKSLPHLSPHLILRWQRAILFLIVGPKKWFFHQKYFVSYATFADTAGLVYLPRFAPSILQHTSAGEKMRSAITPFKFPELLSPNEAYGRNKAVM